MDNSNFNEESQCEIPLVHCITPLDANKVQEFLEKILFGDNKLNSLMCLSENITSINTQTYMSVLDESLSYTVSQREAFKTTFWERIENIDMFNQKFNNGLNGLNDSKVDFYTPHKNESINGLPETPGSGSGGPDAKGPLDADKVDALLKTVLLRCDKLDVIMCLNQNITSIKPEIFIDLLYGINQDIQQNFITMFLEKVENIDMTIIRQVLNNLTCDEKKIAFCIQHKEFLLTVHDFKPQMILRYFARYTVRNIFNETFDLPLEIVEDKGKGFHILGLPIKMEEYLTKTDAKYHFNDDPNIVSGTFIKMEDLMVDKMIIFRTLNKEGYVKLTKQSDGMIKIEQIHENRNISCKKQCSSNWFIDEDGGIYEE